MEVAFSILFTFVVLVLLIGISVIWIPLASGICALIAWRKGLDTKRYALIGGIYSALLFFPWLYLVLRMLNIAVPRFLIVTVYVALYSGWLIGTIILVGIVIAVSTTVPDLNSYAGYQPKDLIERFPDIAKLLVAFSFLSWVWSMAQLFQSNASQTQPLNYDPARHDYVPRLKYVLPFGLATMWTVLFYSLGHISF